MNQNPKARYWISTLGVRPLVFQLYTTVPDNTVSIMFGVKECNWFTYFLFKRFRINLLAKDKLQWLRH